MTYHDLPRPTQTEELLWGRSSKSYCDLLRPTTTYYDLPRLFTQDYPTTYYDHHYDLLPSITTYYELLRPSMSYYDLLRLFSPNKSWPSIVQEQNFSRPYDQPTTYPTTSTYDLLLATMSYHELPRATKSYHELLRATTTFHPTSYYDKSREWKRAIISVYS